MAWGLEAVQVLPPQHYNPSQHLSLDTLEGLALLSETVTLRHGRTLLLAQIQSRTMTKATAFKGTDLHLKRQDVLKAKIAAGLNRITPSLDTQAPEQTTPTDPDDPPSLDLRKKRKAVRDVSYRPRTRIKVVRPTPRLISPPIALAPSAVGDPPTTTHAELRRSSPAAVDEQPETDRPRWRATDRAKERLTEATTGSVRDNDIPKHSHGHPSPSSQSQRSVPIDADRNADSSDHSSIGSSPSIELMRNHDGPNGFLPSETDELTLPFPSNHPSVAGSEGQSALERAEDSSVQEPPPSPSILQLDWHGDEVESTLDSATDCLRSQKPLNSTCIEMVLAIVATGRLEIVDPAYVDCTAPKIKPPLRRECSHLPTTFLIPLHHPQPPAHWTLAALRSGKATFYNSCRSSQYEQQAQKALEMFYRSQSQPYSSPPLDFEVCNTPQQNNDVDCGTFILAYAVYLTAQRPFPPRINAVMWRFIFNAMLDASFSTSDLPSNDPPSLLWPDDLPNNKSVDHGSQGKREIDRREQYHAHLRGQVRSLPHKLAVSQDAVNNVKELSTTLHVIKEQRDELHDLVQQEQEAIIAECERFTHLQESITRLGFLSYGASVKESVAKPHAEARATRDRINKEYHESASRQMAMARGMAAVTTIHDSYSRCLCAVKEKRQAMVAEIRQIDRHEERVRVEREQWMRELEEGGS
ncbi:MAG: hypothetical protein Q9184_007326 [Pyrenodesmia sp. 2 TL-2023]